MMLTVGCSGGGPRTTTPRWAPLPSPLLAASGQPFVASVNVGGRGQPLLLGGVVITRPPSSGEFFSSQGSRRVALWAAPSLTGPWHESTMEADLQRDGPYETIEYLVSDGPKSFAFGWRNSPTEGYPRPSAWRATGSVGTAWQEIVESREFFGGPNIVAFGGAAAGPHGEFVAGTWTNPTGRTVISVWRSTDGSTWTQDASDPTFEGLAGEIPFASGVADAAAGVLVTGTEEIPTHADPTGRRGAAWFSPDGWHWSRVLAGKLAAQWPQSVFGAVAATATRWLIAGESGAAGAPTVWTIGATGDSISASPLPGVRSGATLTAISASPTRVVVAGVVSGRPVMWTAQVRSGAISGWSPVSSPPATDVQSVSLSTGSQGTIVSLIGRDATAVWTTDWH
jgi:hypothetical protein